MTLRKSELRVRWAAVLPSALVATIALLVCAPWAWGSQSQEVTFEAPRDLLSKQHRASAFSELDSLGVRSLRIVLYWKDVAPQPLSRVRPDFDATDPVSYDWSKYAPAIEEASRRGWHVLLTISGPVPIWASNGAVSETYSPRPVHFEAFVTAVSRRFSPYVTRYAIYNEPNHPKFLTPQFDARHNPVSPKIYRGLYAAALHGLAANGDTHPVLMGETAPRGSSEVLAPLRFLRESLCLNDAYQRRPECELFRVDGWATHPYTGKSPFVRRLPKDDVTIGTLGRLTAALDKAAATGAIRAGLPVFLTEFGMQSRPDRLGLSPLRQAEYRAIAEQVAWSNPRVASFAQYLLRDDRPRPGKKSERYGGFETGLRYSNGGAKPSLSAFRLPLVATRRAGGVSLWGLVRPGQGTRAVTVQVADAGKRWSVLATVTTDVNGYWTLETSAKRHRRWRVSAVVGTTKFSGPPTRAYRGV
jgi:hypothetical protein